MTQEEHIDMVLQHEIKKCSNLVGAEMLKSLNFDDMERTKNLNDVKILLDTAIDLLDHEGEKV